MKPGLYPGWSNAAYQHGPGLSCSQIKRLLKTPFHMHALTLPRDVPEKAPTPQMFNGTLTHCALLEPDQFDLRYPVVEVNRRTKAGREMLADYAAEGVEVVDRIQRAAAWAQADSLRALPEVAELLGNGQPEVSSYWVELVDGVEVLCRCRPDWVAPVGRAGAAGVVLLDVKTAADASPEGFAKAVQNFGYHIQAEWYCKGYARASGQVVHGMLFAVVESEYPYAAACYMLDDAALGRARSLIGEALQTYARCSVSGSWPGYPSGIQVITLPKWAY